MSDDRHAERTTPAEESDPEAEWSKRQSLPLSERLKESARTVSTFAPTSEELWKRVIADLRAAIRQLGYYEQATEVQFGAAVSACRDTPDGRAWSVWDRSGSRYPKKLGEHLDRGVAIALAHRVAQKKRGSTP